jgi:hypothetical protein
MSAAVWSSIHGTHDPGAADIYLCLPGLGDVLSARVLGEVGDARDRYASAKSRQNYCVCGARTARFLPDATVRGGRACALCSISSSPPAAAPITTAPDSR